MSKEKTLAEILYKQLKDSGNFKQVRIDSFSDGSGTWIDCYHTLDPDEKGRRWVKQLSFNGEGTMLEDVQVWEEKMTWSDDQRELR
jgi:hypothetical protein